MHDVDVIIAGAGPAGLLVGSGLARRGLRTVLVDPNGGRPGPQASHVHLLSDETWAGMCALLPNLERRVLHMGAPMAPPGAAMLDGELSGRRRAWPDRPRLDRAMYDGVVRDIGTPVLRHRLGPIRRHGGCWHATDCRAPWLIDASGGSRATLRAAAVFGSVEWMEWGDRRGYASLVLEGMNWPEDRVGHGFRATDGNGLVLRKTDARRTLVTLQLVQAGIAPETPGEFFDRVFEVAPTKLARWVCGGSPVSGVSRWSSRRSGGILADEGLAEIGWMAVGDALLNTAPHQGQGLSHIVQQVELMCEVLDSGSGLDAVAIRLTRWAGQRAMAATLTEGLWSPGCADAAAA